MPPKIFIEGDREAALAFIPQAKQLLYTVRARAETSGVPVLSQHLSPDPDTTIYALVSNGQEIISITVLPKGFKRTTEPKLQEDLPDLLSGTVRVGSIRIVGTPDPNPERPQVAKYFDSFKPVPATEAYYARAAGQGTNEVPSGYNWNKRLAVRPSKDFPHLLVENDKFESAQCGLLRGSMYSGRMQKLVQAVLGYGKLPASTQTSLSQLRQKDVAGAGVQLLFDHRYSRTHILTRDNKGDDWLVEISMGRGVLAQRLQVYKNSYELLKDSEREDIQEVVREFKGLPTGESLPTAGLLDKAIADGSVLRLATADDLKPFYAMQPYSTAMGWVCNTEGTEAHNTGWYWHPDQFKRSAHYYIRIKLTTDAKGITSGTAKLSKVREGAVYHPAKVPPAIKFHEPLLGGLQSVGMRAATNDEDAPEPDPKDIIGLCDAPIHVCYIDGNLDVVNYFWDSAGVDLPTRTTNNFPECPFVGAFRAETVTMPDTGPPTFYSTRFDTRKAYAVSSRVDTMTSTDLGTWFYRWTDDPFRQPLGCWGTLSRFRAYRQVTVGVTLSGTSHTAAVVIPDGTRNCYAFAEITVPGQENRVETVNYVRLDDPNTYTLYRNFYKQPEDGCYDDTFRGKDGPNAVGGVSECQAQFTDHGNWFGDCQDGEFPMQQVPVGWQTATNSYPTPELKLHLVTSTELATIQLPVVGDPGARIANWNAMSPDKFGNVQTMFANHNCWGRPAVTYAEGIDGARVAKGEVYEGRPEFNYNYLGVV